MLPEDITGANTGGEWSELAESGEKVKIFAISLKCLCMVLWEL